MATVTLTSGQRFPAGTSVSAYPASNWSGPALNPSGAPAGPAAATATVAVDSTLAFAGLTAETAYWAYALVGGEHRYVAFSIRSAVLTRLDSVESGQVPISYGTLAGRPAAGAVVDKSCYFATDDNGGTLYQARSGAWVKAAPGVLEVATVVPLGYVESLAVHTNSTTTPTDIPSLTGMEVTFPASGVIELSCDLVVSNDTAGSKAVVSVVDDLAVAHISVAHTSSAAGAQGQIKHSRKITAAPATVRTYKAQLSRATSGTAFSLGSASNAMSLKAIPSA